MIGRETSVEVMEVDNHQEQVQLGSDVMSPTGQAIGDLNQRTSQGPYLFPSPPHETGTIISDEEFP
jgi:hypothetical protein